MELLDSIKAKETGNKGFMCRKQDLKMLGMPKKNKRVTAKFDLLYDLEQEKTGRRDTESKNVSQKTGR